MSEFAAHVVPSEAPAPGGRSPGRLRPTRTGDVGRDLACRLYSAETGEFVASTETGHLPREQDLANAAFIRLAWNQIDALLEIAINDRSAIMMALDYLPGAAPADVVAALRERVAKIDERLAEIEGAAS